MRLNTFVAGVVTFCIWPQVGVAQCGGVDRWAVKVVADPGQGEVEADAPLSTTLTDLVRLVRPSLPRDEVTRLPSERRVYTVDAFLVKFKRESGKTGDADFHLVLSDETGLYSAGGASSPVSPHSFIAEIPDPACVAGRKATVTVPSRFQAQLATVRTQFEARFNTASKGWVEVGNVPVRVTGVAFFDRPHGQVGRALNGIELHPLLAIEFEGTGTAPDTAASTLRNADFEFGSTDWHASPDVISDDPDEPARSGRWKAWLAGYGEPHRDHLWQAVTVPAGVRSAALTFYLRIDTEEESSRPVDKLYVRVRDDSGALKQTLATYTNVDGASRYLRRSLSLTAYRGRTVRIAFETQEDQGSATSFFVDDVRLVTKKP